MALLSTKVKPSWIATVVILFLVWSIWALGWHPRLDTLHIPTTHSSSPEKEETDRINAGLAVEMGKVGQETTTTIPGEIMVGDGRPINTTDSTTPNSPSTTAIPSEPASDRPLILYAYFETENSRQNLEFFIAHALHGAADFMFILNGDNKAEEIIPKKPNIKYIHRKNDCYDLGAFAEVLVKDDLYKKYKKFITMNGSIRGPFLPQWATGCWSDMYLNRVTEQVKLVGMTFNCEPVNHVQSMIWATDRVGLETLLFPTETQIEALKARVPIFPPEQPVPGMEVPGINSCPHEYWKAVAIEVYSTPLIEAAGYKAEAMMSAFHMSEDYEAECKDYPNPLYEGSYFGMTIHPFDTTADAKTRQLTKNTTLTENRLRIDHNNLTITITKPRQKGKSSLQLQQSRLRPTTSRTQW
ncbi:hypothetical protein G7Y89_g12056 [Cudoniella acicularis]|uniref:Uncharacterized protein n=1 Tax=Cudoniella acicularis TaxID=354080 RepID=A0A8H4R9R0_9HELO|nr:hypothetical protein G7Y89_g12056 [Cudoniella acicularis]